MHKLNRGNTEAPQCLSDYDHNTQTWDDFGGECKKRLRAALAQMQGIPGVTTEDASEYGVRCAYCEDAIHHAGHIEHFRRKNKKHFPELTFEWNNLFLACGSNDHCGHYKDRRGADAYNPDDLIKPDIEDPEDYLYFHSSGEVRPRVGIDANKELKANETIRAFGLKDRTLTSSRARALKTYKEKVLDELDEIANWEPELIAEYIQQEIENTQWQAFSTTIKHFLSGVC
ncbi:retron system putative HNH endonuclease [Vibrio alginolyticus]|uniref:retron system putative HNH endonuclease n=1 Tax=Vibrio alginolyticus TaxID=663 RepID=UPI001BD30C6F|nr:retron system putative HNH endonuclease [Vibrio alginolyticus]MBT0034996.1 TIGR02646 family protein [Vibrio alginolyticus]